MKKIKFIKGEVYVIEGHPHFYQGRENEIYKFLKWDGSIKYFYETNLANIAPAPLNKEYEQELKSARAEAAYYRDKYRWYESNENQKVTQKQHEDYKKEKWFSNSRFVQVSVALTILAILIVALNLSIEAGKRSESYIVGFSTFAVIAIVGVLVSLLIGWLAFKIEEFIDEEKSLNTVIKLLFYIPIVWFLLFKLSKIALSLNSDTQ